MTMKIKIPGLYERNGWYYYQPPTIDGKRGGPVALRTQDQGEAVNEIARIREEGEVARVVRKACFMEPLVEEWLKESAADGTHRPKTSAASRSCLLGLTEFWGNPKISWVTRERIIEWRGELSKRPGRGGRLMSESSILSYLRRLGGFLTWCVRRGYLRKDPMADIKIPNPKPTKKQAYCTIEDRELLLGGETSEEVEFILHFGFFAGLRFGEMLAMRREWITGAPGSLVLTVQVTDQWKPKSGRMRVIPVHPRLESFLERYALRAPYMLAPKKGPAKDPAAYRFNPKKQFKNYVTKMGLPWVTYHTLRHSFATHLAVKGAPMYEVAGLLGDGIRVTESNYVAYVPGGKSVSSL